MMEVCSEPIWVVSPSQLVNEEREKYLPRNQINACTVSQDHLCFKCRRQRRASSSFSRLSIFLLSICKQFSLNSRPLTCQTPFGPAIFARAVGGIWCKMSCQRVPRRGVVRIERGRVIERRRARSGVWRHRGRGGIEAG